MKINKLQRNILIYTFFILSTIFFALFPTSNSKYIKENDRALIYSANIYNLYAGEFDNRITLIPEKSTDTEAYLEYMFRHSDVALNAQRDIYELVLAPNTCVIDDANVTYLSRFDKNTNKFTFYPSIDYRTEGYIIVGMRCNIEDMKIDEKNIQAKVSIKEQIVANNILEQQFDYIDLVYNDTLDNYNNTVNPVVPSITIPEKKEDGTDEDVYDKFIKWITTYAKSTNYESEILSYVNTFVTEENVKDIPFPLLGISSIHDEENLTYTFSIAENLIGYARTYLESLHDHPTLMFLTTRDIETLEFAFDYYLKNYIYKDDFVNYQKVLDYVNAQGGIKAIVVDGKNIPGFTFVDELDELLIWNNILNYVNLEVQGNWFNLDFGPMATMYNNFKAAINSLDVAISTDAKKVIIGVSPLYYSYTKNNTKDAPNDEDKKSFTDYFAVNDIENGYYLIFKMSSDVELNSDNKFNKIEVGTYVAPTDFNLEFVNTTEEILTVKMSYTSKQYIEEAINYFDNYFNTTSAVEIPEAVDGVYSVEYQINKVVAK